MTRAALLLFAVIALLPAGAVADEWNRYGPRERYEAMQNYNQHRQLPKQERKNIERQYQRWQQLPDDERAKVRRNYERLQQLSPDERRSFERKYQQWRDHRD